MTHPIAVVDDQLVPTVEKGSIVENGSTDEAARSDQRARARCGASFDPSVRNQRGMVSAEWAVGIIAAIAVAGVLLAVVTSGPVESALLKVILSIIHAFTRNL